MAVDRDGFPEDRDLAIQAEAVRLVNYADELTEWVGLHGANRRDGRFEINATDEFQLLRLRRLATNLFNSAKVPVASAVYGPSQVGKSLFMGRVLSPADDRDSPLGKCDTLSPDAYIRELSFDADINPQSGSNEATALVTRFTTKDRFDPEALSEYPVKVRALSRSEWLRVLARGFRSECPPSTATWEEGQIRELFETVSQSHGTDAGNRDWQMDLIDTYAYLRSLDHRQFKVDEAMFNSFLSRYPLSESGYVEVAGRLFWDSTSAPDVRGRITQLFNDVRRYIAKVRQGGRDGILIHWGAAKYLLDSQRAPDHLKNEASAWKQDTKWTDFADSIKGDWYVLDYAPGGRGPADDVSVIQAAMLELVIPVVPHRLNGEWREVVKKMDILDLPGMVAGGGDSEGRSNTAQSLEEKMMIVKRGKVFYLIERYIEERQVQTLLLLMRGGNVNVRQLLKEYVDKWGHTRYGQDVWPQRVQASTPALFIGMTGLDEEFETREVNKDLYQARLNNIVEHTLCEVMKDFGGVGRRFTNVFPIRYPGTWDADEQRRQRNGPSKWEAAQRAFLATPLVKEFVKDPEKKWQAAMQDNDGGMSLICTGFLECTSSVQKQETLEGQIKEIQQTVRNLAQSWYVDPDANVDRDKRLALGKRVLEWLADEEFVYERVQALKQALCFDPGNAMELAEFSEQRSGRGRTEKIEDRFPKRLHDFLKEWATTWAIQRWQQHINEPNHNRSWLADDDFSDLARYLSDYLRCDSVFEPLSDRLLRIITLQVSDQGARRHVVREYVQLVLNDFVLNPGPTTTPLDAQAGINGHNFGLMNSFVLRWHQRLPLALASAAGVHTEIPVGNDEISKILKAY